MHVPSKTWKPNVIILSKLGLSSPQRSDHQEKTSQVMAVCLANECPGAGAQRQWFPEIHTLLMKPPSQEAKVFPPNSSQHLLAPRMHWERASFT